VTVNFGDTVGGPAVPGSFQAGWNRGSYANPHHTIALRDIPTNLKQVMRLCRFYYTSDALMGAIVDKMAEYPITELILDAKDNRTLSQSMRDRWDTLLNVSLNLRQVMIDINVDKAVYGNSFLYFYYPFVRYCVCKSCSFRAPIQTFKKIQVRVVNSAAGPFSFEVSTVCPKCSETAGAPTTSTFSIQDMKSANRKGMRIVRLAPTRMQLEYNPASGARQWYWVPPARLRDGLVNGERTVIDTTEMAVLEAAHNDKRIEMNPSRLWVSQAAHHPDLWEGWGVPPIFRVLEDVYFMKVLRRANEALAQEHVTPARFISPGSTSDVSPQRTLNMSDWQNRLRSDLYKLKQDPNHIIVTPIPINIEQMGGQARVMMTAPEIEGAARIIACGLGCPIELIWGGLNWSGASVSLRLLENHFINMREDCERLLDYLVPRLAMYFQLTPINVKLAEFKMADDVQQQANAINLMLQGYLDRQSVVGEMGYDPDQVFTRLETEHKRLNKITMQDNVAASHMNTVIQALEAKANVLLQYELEHLQTQIQIQSERDRLSALNAHVKSLHAKGYATPLEFEQSAMILQTMDPNMSSMIMQQWSQTMPNVVALLNQRLQLGSMQRQVSQSAMGAAPGAADAGAAAETQTGAAAGPYAEGQAPETMSPPGNALPNMKPPRSGPGEAQI
jgi:hypothetical protein